MKMKNGSFIIMAAVLVMLAGCRSGGGMAAANIEAISEGADSEQAAARTDSLREAAEIKLLRGLTNKAAESLNVIIPDFRGSETGIVLVTGRFDCVSCVEAGFRVLDKIKRTSGPGVKTYAVGITKEVNYDIDSKYDGTVYEDKEGKLHEELGFAPTPIIVVLMDGRIIDLHKPFDASSGLSQKFIDGYSLK